MVVIVEIGANSKTYKNIKFAKSKMHLRQRLFEVKDGLTITSGALKDAINKASRKMPTKICQWKCVYNTRMSDGGAEPYLMRVIIAVCIVRNMVLSKNSGESKPGSSITCLENRM